jgi:hypothetical protein
MKNTAAVQTKRCPECKKHKPISEFARNRSKKSGLASACKQCECARMRIYYAANREKIIAKVHKYEKDNPEKIAVRKRVYYEANKERTKPQRRKYRETNREKLIAGQRLWYENNREKVAKRNRKWYKANLDKVRDRTTLRRARKAGATGSHTAAQFRALIEATGGICLCCGRHFTDDLRPTEDHIVPLSKGGSDDITNIQPLCHSCNCSKYVKIKDFRQIKEANSDDDQ